MKGHGEKLSRKQEVAIAAMLTEPTMSAAARRTGVSEVTLWRWLQNPEFRERYRQARRQVLESAIGQLQTATSEAVKTLRRNLQSEADTVQVRAAVAILDHAFKGTELLDLEQRLEALEEATKVTGG